MSPYEQAAATLRAAVEPLAAYCARTPPGNRHADHCAALVDSIADYVEAVEEALAPEPPAPDFEAVAFRLFARFPYQPPPSALVDRTRHHLDSLKARAALPLAQRMHQATITSHHLGTPDYLRL